MAERFKSSPRDRIDAPKTDTTAPASPKPGKPDENIVVKTAHTIRDKVHELTTEVKEKAHNLKHNDNSKKK